MFVFLAKNLRCLGNFCGIGWLWFVEVFTILFEVLKNRAFLSGRLVASFGLGVSVWSVGSKIRSGATTLETTRTVKRLPPLSRYQPTFRITFSSMEMFQLVFETHFKIVRKSKHKFFIINFSHNRYDKEIQIYSVQIIKTIFFNLFFSNFPLFLSFNKNGWIIKKRDSIIINFIDKKRFLKICDEIGRV